jgi:xylan 1,4-beta-xylosidase
MTDPTFSSDLTLKPESFCHFWEHTIGSGHATLALRADWQKQITRCQKELGFKHVRFHGLLSDDMGTLTCQNDKLVYSFYNANTIFDFLISIGMKPFVELSFMPTTLSSGTTTVFHYKSNVTPPKDFHQWEVFIKKLVQNWVSRYGLEEVSQWFFEVWNEPNLKAFWTGTQEDYFKFYHSTSKAIKSVHESLKVGGPATADNSWVPEFLTFCEKSKSHVDFISTHHYPTDAFGKPGDDTVTQLAESRRSVLREEALNVKNQSKGKPLYYTEWSTSSNPFDTLHDQPYASAFITKTIMEAHGIVEGYSYWTFSDIFEENYFSSSPFHGGFGLLNVEGIPKPAYRAYQLLHHLGDEIFPVTGHHTTVDLWITRKGSTIKILCTNSSLPRHPIQKEKVQVNLSGIHRIKHSYIERIDDSHANAPQTWADMGKPEYLDQEQVAKLEISSSLVREEFLVKEKDHYLVLKFEIPSQGTVCVTLEEA